MSKTIQMTFTDEQWTALSDVAVDPKEWIANAAITRAAAAADARRADPQWINAIVSLVGAGGDVNDPLAVLAHGAASGLFKDAATREAEFQAAMAERGGEPDVAAASPVE